MTARAATAGWQITIRCAAEVHPADARPVVAVARRRPEGWEGPRWSFEERGRTVAAPLREQPEGPAIVDDVMNERADRWAYRLRCPKCPENVPVGDEAELRGLMDARAAAGKRSDTLQRIRASRKEAGNRTM